MILQALEIEDQNHRAKEGLQRVQKLQKQAKKRDYYKILNVKKNANKKEIIKAYRYFSNPLAVILSVFNVYMKIAEKRRSSGTRTTSKVTRKRLLKRNLSTLLPPKKY